MSEFYSLPYAEITWGPQPDGYPVTGSARTFYSQSYEHQVRDALTHHTGSPETFLTIDQEQTLATAIQDGLAAEAERTAVENRMDQSDLSEHASLWDEHHALSEAIKAGKVAEHALIRCNLRLAAYLARASMNLLPWGDREAVNDDSRAGARQRALIQTDKPWIPRDFTDLASPHGTLDDRVQVANLALIKAARTFKPGVLNNKGGLVAFKAYAATVIKTELTKYAYGGHPGSHEMPVHVPESLTDRVRQMRRDPSGFTAEELGELQRIDNLQNMVSWDELIFAGAADEEIGWDGEDPMLSAAEIIAEETFTTHERVLARLRREQIYRTLGRLKREREGGVMRLLYGFTDGTEYSPDQIGDVYFIGASAVRALIPRIIPKLRQRRLRAFYNVDENSGIPLRSGDVVKTQRTLGHISADQPVDTGDQGREALESWQTYSGELWDESVRLTTAELESEYANTAALFRQALFTAAPYSFQRSFKQQMGSAYPRGLVKQISKTFGPELTADHIADFWNRDLEHFVEHITAQLGGEADPDRVTQLLFRLLAERTHDTSVIELRIPKKLDGRLGFVGAWLGRGLLKILGNVGDNAGFGMNTLGHLHIEGNARHYAGSNMKGHAILEINGNAGDFAGFAMGGNASMVVRGNIGTYGGYHMDSKNALIEVTGTTGDKLGFAAYRGGIIVGDEIKFAK